MSDFLISPSRDTDWRLDHAEFVRLMQDRWPDAAITWFDERRSVVALDFRVPDDFGAPIDGNLHRDGRAVGVDGSVEQGALVAAWMRGIVPATQELTFYDVGYSFDVRLTEGIQPEQIAAAVPTD